jgi:glutaredoxin
MIVEIYGAEWCGFCKRAVALCEEKALEYKYIDIDDTENLRLLQERIVTRVRTVPQIFVDGEYIKGGYNGLVHHLSNRVPKST